MCQTEFGTEDIVYLQYRHNVMIGRERDDIDCLPNANELITLHWRKAPYMDSKASLIIVYLDIVFLHLAQT